MMVFSNENSNQLLINSRLSSEEKKIIFELQIEFEKNFGGAGYFLIASSGSSQKSNESVKLIALSIESVLASAQRVNFYLRASAKDHWGLVLPSFHVAGLGIYARAFLAKSQVFSMDWNIDELSPWISNHQISFLSMVPAQIYDIVQKKVVAPECVKKIFVGASQLDEDLRGEAFDLGWPLVETYGMTETASMIAVKEEDDFKLLSGVEVEFKNGLLGIKCDSLLTASIQKIEDKIVINDYSFEKFYQTSDKAEIFIKNGTAVLRFLGRNTDYVKILGEGVSLGELRSLLVKALMIKNISLDVCEIIAVQEARSGHKLVLVVEKSLDLLIANEIVKEFNNMCRPYEKIQDIIVLGQIPRTELGKLKREELSRIVNKELKREVNGES